MIHLITFHIQKDKRITLGTCVHIYKSCPGLKSRTSILEIAGEIVQHIPKCYWCFSRLIKNPDYTDSKTDTEITHHTQVREELSYDEQEEADSF